MIYTDLENLIDSTGIENKYALAMIVATRARQLSEQKGNVLSGEGSELCITHSIEELENSELDITSSYVSDRSSDAAEVA